MAEMSGHRLFRFPKPQWLNSANTRNAGIYLAGALVSHPIHTLLKPKNNDTLTRSRRI